MKLKIYSLIVLIFFLFISCTPNFDYKAKYDSGSYQEIIDYSKDVLSNKLDKDSLYYLFMSQFKMGYIDDSLSAARLYAACYKKDQDQKLRDSLRILLFYSNEAEKCYAGGLMKSYFTLSEPEMIAYFTALMRTKDYQLADVIYNESKTTLSTKSRCMMLISGKASSDLIIKELRDLDENPDSDFDSILIQAINVLNERGDGDLILNLAINHYDSSKDNLALAIGDIYFFKKDIAKARSYWSIAYTSYPDEVKRRLTYL